MQYTFDLKVLKTAMVWATPFFTALLNSLVKLIVSPTPAEAPQGCTTACTDGRRIWLVADFMAKLPAKCQMWVLAHEIYHIICRHPSRMAYYARMGLAGRPFSAELYNISADGVINKNLDNIPGIMKPPASVIEVVDIPWVTGRETPEEVYKKLLEEADKEAGGPGQATSQMAGQSAANKYNPSHGGMQEPSAGNGVGEDEDDAPPTDQEVRSAVAGAAQAAKSRGTIPGGLKSLIDEIEEPKVDWREELRMEMVKCAGGGTTTWKKPRRRRLVSHGVYEPKRQGLRIGEVVLAVDTSGSVSDMELKAFISEMGAILQDVRPEKTYVVWCDARVDRVDEVDTMDELLSLTRAEGIPGRGGTSFQPPFDWVQKKGLTPSVLVYLTDGYAPAPKNTCDVKTVWVVSNSTGLSPEPFGKRITLEVN